MDFEYETKNRANIRKHGLDFEDAEEMFRRVVAAEPDTRGKAVDWAGPDPRSRRARGFRGTRTGHHSHHLAQKGNQA
jgi:hypothetical protein